MSPVNGPGIKLDYSNRTINNQFSGPAQTKPIAVGSVSPSLAYSVSEETMRELETSRPTGLCPL